MLSSLEKMAIEHFHSWDRFRSSSKRGAQPQKQYFSAVIKSRGPGIFPSYYEHAPQLLPKENRRKIEPKEILSSFIPRLLVVFTRQLEILVTSPL